MVRQALTAIVVVLGMALVAWSTAAVSRFICGGLPPGWPSEFPLVPGTRVLGSIVNEDGAFACYLELPAWDDETAVALVEGFAAAGWEPLSRLVEPERTLILRRGKEALFITPWDKERAQVTVTYVPVARWDRGFTFAPLFSLSPPEGATFLSTSSGRSTDGAWFHATVVSARRTDELFRNLHKQLLSQGGVLVDSGNGGPVSWGRYTLEHDSELWGLILVVAAVPELPSTYELSVMAERLKRGR